MIEFMSTKFNWPSKKILIRVLGLDKNWMITSSCKRGLVSRHGQTESCQTWQRSTLESLGICCWIEPRCVGWLVFCARCSFKMVNSKYVSFGWYTKLRKIFWKGRWLKNTNNVEKSISRTHRQQSHLQSTFWDWTWMLNKLKGLEHLS